MKIGVISDTHNFFDPRIPSLFAGVNHILHGGDIGEPGIIVELEYIAPVTAVLGNSDDPWYHYPRTKIIKLAERTFLLHHIVDPGSPRDPIVERAARARPSVVIFGHTHKPFCETIKGVLYFNPGYAGKPRFRMKRTLAILHCTSEDIRPEFLTL